MIKFIMILFTLLLTSSCIDNKEPEGLGIAVRKIGKRGAFTLAPCYEKTCISSQKEITEEKRQIEPIRITATKDIAFEKIMKIVLKEKDINIVYSTDSYIRAKQTLYGKLITDLEFYFGKNKEIQLRAHMRGIPHDLGNGRRILEKIRFKFHQNDY